MLEKLMLLRRGELVYGGYLHDAPTYFKALGYVNEVGDPPHQLMNPADFYIEVCFGLIPKTAHESHGELCVPPPMVIRAEPSPTTRKCRTRRSPMIKL